MYVVYEHGEALIAFEHEQDAQAYVEQQAKITPWTTEGEFYDAAAL